MITNEQVEAALKAWYDAGDAGNFASMFAALKAADLASVARIAALEAALKPFADDAQYHENRSDIFTIDHDDRITVADLRAARAALEKKND